MPRTAASVSLASSIACLVMPSPLGPLQLTAAGGGLLDIRFLALHPSEATPTPGAERHAVLRATRRQLEEYFAGRRRRFQLPLAKGSGTPFQRRVWAALQRIPYGGTASYGEIAARVGRPGAARAVGGANRANPWPIVVPCHRVLGASGALVGYSGTRGLPLKVQLLEHEQATQRH